MRALALVLTLLVSLPPALLPVAAIAVQPDEMLADPALEARARAISEGLRCPVCQNETIDESSAPVARDLRIYVRERIAAGDSDAEVVAAVVDRFGEFVLLRPDARGWNLLLWLAAPGMLLLAAGVGIATVRNRAGAAPPEELSAEERARLDEILKS